MTSGKSVWIVNQYAGSRHHGMEYRHFYLGRELVAKGWDVTIISGSYSHLFTRPPRVHGAVTVEEIDGVRYCWLRVPPYEGVGSGRAVNMVAFAIRLLSRKLRQLPAPDAIVVSSPSPFPIVPAALWARRYRARLVYEVRDIWPLTLVALGWVSRRHPIVAVMRWVERYAYRRADRIVSPLPNALKHMRRYGVEAHRFHYVPNGVSVGDFDDAPNLSPEIRAQLPDDKFVVGYVGTMGPANAIESLLQAAHRLRDEPAIEFVLVGTGRSKDALEQLAAELSLPNVRFLDPVPRAQVPALLRACDALFIGLQRNDLYKFGISPNKLFDYMYSGRPIVQAVGHGGTDPVGAAGCGVSVEAEDPEAIAAAIAAIHATPPDERERLGRAGRSYVIGHHAYSVLADQYIALLNGRAPRHAEPGVAARA